MKRLNKTTAVFVFVFFLLHTCLYNFVFACLVVEDCEKNRGYASVPLVDVVAFSKVRFPSLTHTQISIRRFYEKSFNDKNTTILDLSVEQTKRYRIYAQRLNQDSKWQAVVDAYVLFRQLSKDCIRPVFGQALGNFLLMYDAFFQQETNFGNITERDEEPHHLPLADRVFRRRMIPIVLIANAQLRLLGVSAEHAPENITFDEQMQRPEIENGKRSTWTSEDHTKSEHTIPHILHLLTRNVEGMKISLSDSNVLSEENDIMKLSRFKLHVYDIYYTSLMYREAIDVESYQEVYPQDISKLSGHNLKKYDDAKAVNILKYDLPDEDNDSFLNIGLVQHGFNSIFIRKKEYSFSQLLPPEMDSNIYMDPAKAPKVYHEYQSQIFAVEIARVLGIRDINREGMASNFINLMGVPSPEVYFYSTSTIYMGAIQGKRGIASDAEFNISSEINDIRQIYDQLGMTQSRKEVYSYITNPSSLNNKLYVSDTKMDYTKFVEMGKMLMIDICLGNNDRFYGRLNASNILIDSQGTLNFIDTTFSAVSIFEVIVYNFLHEKSHFMLHQELARAAVNIESRHDLSEDLYFRYYEFLFRIVSEYVTTGEISFIRRLLSKEEKYIRYPNDEDSEKELQWKLEFVSAYIPDRPFLTDKNNKDYVVRAMSEGMIEGLLMIGRKFNPFYFTNLDQQTSEEELNVIRNIFAQTREFVSRYLPDIKTAYELLEGELPITFKDIPYQKSMIIDVEASVFRSDPMSYKYMHIPPKRPVRGIPKLVIFQVEVPRWYFMIESAIRNTDNKYDVHLGLVVFRPDGDIVLQFSNANGRVQHNQEILIIPKKKGKYLGAYPHYPNHEKFDASISKGIGDFIEDLKDLISLIFYQTSIQRKTPISVIIKNRISVDTSLIDDMRTILGMDSLPGYTGGVIPSDFQSMLGTLGDSDSDFYKIISRAERYIAKTDQVQVIIPLSHDLDSQELYEKISNAYDVVFNNVIRRIKDNVENKKVWKERKIILDQYLMLLAKIEKNIKLGHTLSKVKVQLEDSKKTVFSEDQVFLEGNRRGIKIGFYVPNKDIAHTDVLTVLSVIADKQLDKVIWLPFTQEEEEILKDSLSMYGELFEVATAPSSESKKVSKDELFHRMLELNRNRRMDSYYIQQNEDIAKTYLINVGDTNIFSDDFMLNKDNHRIHVILCDLDNFLRKEEESRSKGIISKSRELMQKNLPHVNIEHFSNIDTQTGKEGDQNWLFIRSFDKKIAIDYFFKYTELFYELKDVETIQVGISGHLPQIEQSNFHLFLHDYSKRFINSDASITWTDKQIFKTQDEVWNKDVFLGHDIKRNQEEQRDQDKIISCIQLAEEPPRSIELKDGITDLNKLYIQEKDIFYFYEDVNKIKHLYFLKNISIPTGIQNAIYAGHFEYFENRMKYSILGTFIDATNQEILGGLQGSIKYSPTQKKPSKDIINYKEYMTWISVWLKYLSSSNYYLLGEAKKTDLSIRATNLHTRQVTEMISQLLTLQEFKEIQMNSSNFTHPIHFLQMRKGLAHNMIQRAIVNFNFNSIITAVEGEQQALQHEIDQGIKERERLYSEHGFQNMKDHISFFSYASRGNKQVNIEILLVPMEKNEEEKCKQLFFSFIGPIGTEFEKGIYQGLIEIIEPGHATVLMLTENKGIKSGEYIHVYHPIYNANKWDIDSDFVQSVVDLVGQVADAMSYGRQIPHATPWLHNTNQVLSKMIAGEEERFKQRNLWQQGVQTLLEEDIVLWNHNNLSQQFSDKFQQIVHFGIGTALKHIQTRSQSPADTLIKKSDITNHVYDKPHQCHFFSVSKKEGKTYFVFQGPGTTEADPFFKGIYYGYATETNNRIHITLLTKNPLFPHHTAYILPPSVKTQKDGIRVFISLFSDSSDYDLRDIKLYTLPQNTGYYKTMRLINNLNLGYHKGFDMASLKDADSINTFLVRIANVIQNIEEMLQQQ